MMVNKLRKLIWLDPRRPGVIGLTRAGRAEMKTNGMAVCDHLRKYARALARTIGRQPLVDLGIPGSPWPVAALPTPGDMRRAVRVLKEAREGRRSSLSVILTESTERVRQPRAAHELPEHLLGLVKFSRTDSGAPLLTVTKVGRRLWHGHGARSSRFINAVLKYAGTLGNGRSRTAWLRVGAKG